MNSFKILVNMPEGNIYFAMCRLSWKEYINMSFQERL